MRRVAAGVASVSLGVVFRGHGLGLASIRVPGASNLLLGLVAGFEASWRAGFMAGSLAGSLCGGPPSAALGRGWV